MSPVRGGRGSGACLVGLVLGLVTVAGCASAPPPPGPPSPSPSPPSQPAVASSAPAVAPSSTRYVDDQDGYGITPPDGWRVGTSAQSLTSVAFYKLPPDMSGSKPFPSNMNVVVAGTDVGLDENVAAAREQLPGVLSNYRPTVDERVQLPGGQPAQLLGGTYAEEGLELRNLQLVVVSAGKSYSVTATTPAASFARYEDAVRRSLFTFALTSG